MVYDHLHLIYTIGSDICLKNFPVLIFMTTITACCILNLETTHLLSRTWTGEFDPLKTLLFLLCP
jgi:hypothetical protein